MIRALRGSPGGRFRLTPRHRLVLVFRSADDGPPVPYVVGQVATPFELLDTDGAQDIDVSMLKPGEPYAGSLDKNGGSYKLRQKHGGVIERRGGPSGSEFAVDGRGALLARNAVLLLDAWRSLGRSGLTFHVNSAGHAWFLDAGVPLFLAAVSGGFTWPSDLTISDKGRP
jgi:hypothetical protein